MNRLELKNSAKEVLRGKWFDESILVLVVGLITGLPGVIFKGNYVIIAQIMNILLAPIAFGYARHLLLLVRGENKGFDDILYYYKEGRSFEIIILIFITGMFIVLWSLLFVIPGIIAAYRYTLSQYLAHDNPELQAGENLKLSSNMMNGFKFDYFALTLSFLGWAILAGITVIGLFPFAIYVGTTNALFYEKVRQAHLGHQEAV